MKHALDGKAIVYVDEIGRQHDALVLTTHGTQDDETPTINLVHVTHDPDKRDSYGLQIERPTSVQHQSKTSAQGRYWAHR